MPTQKATPAPIGFRNLLKNAMESQGLTNRKLADLTNISPAFISRLLSGQRGVPTNEVIARLENALQLEPKQLLYEAGRIDRAVQTVLQKPGAPLLMRTLAPLSAADFLKVQQVADDLARKHRQTSIK
jgi:transcriptional regulator with XRE-family HTH domain